MIVQKGFFYDIPYKKILLFKPKALTTINPKNCVRLDRLNRWVYKKFPMKLQNIDPLK